MGSPVLASSDDHTGVASWAFNPKPSPDITLSSFIPDEQFKFATAELQVDNDRIRRHQAVHSQLWRRPVRMRVESTLAALKPVGASFLRSELDLAALPVEARDDERTVLPRHALVYPMQGVFLADGFGFHLRTTGWRTIGIHDAAPKRYAEGNLRSLNRPCQSAGTQGEQEEQGRYSSHLNRITYSKPNDALIATPKPGIGVVHPGKSFIRSRTWPE
jgi:hypothetical protein